MAAPDPLASLGTPDRLGRYEVLERLGAGGMAEVLVCIRHGAAGFARAVAVKRVLPFLAKDRGFRAMLRREAAIAASMDHPNCVRIDELEEIEGELLLSMELLYGVDAAELVRRVAHPSGGVPAPVALRVAVDALRGLHHVHGLSDADGAPLGVVHRDVSPHNLFVTRSGMTKVLDFGIATAVEAVDRDTMTGALKGKFRYMAPEQVDLKSLDARTDVWAMAVTIYEMIAGRPMLTGAMLDVLDALRDRALSIDWDAGPGFEPALRSILEAALAFDPAERTASAEALADVIEARCEVAPHREVARLVDTVARDEVEELRRRVAAALRTEERLSGEAAAVKLSEPPPSGESSVDALGTTAPGKVSARRSEEVTRPARPSPTPAPEGDPEPGGARDTVADETVSPLATLGARDTLREEVHSPLSSLPPPRRTPSSTPYASPPSARPRVWPAVVATFTVGALLGWLVAELVF